MNIVYVTTTATFHGHTVKQGRKVVCKVKKRCGQYVVEFHGVNLTIYCKTLSEVNTRIRTIIATTACGKNGWDDCDVVGVNVG